MEIDIEIFEAIEIQLLKWYGPIQKMTDVEENIGK